MPQVLELASLTELVSPENCVLFLGAGASTASGAPTATELARILCRQLAHTELSDDLTEASTILENRYGRPQLVQAVRELLNPLKPAGGMLMLPRHGWHAIYTTNFDLLIENAYREASAPLNVIRSNFDYAAADQAIGTPLLKLHGCISQDIVDGSQARMVLTEQDYELADKYREALFSRLTLNMTTKDVLVVGHSLRDPRLQADMKRVAQLHAERGAPGRLLLLTYENDPDRSMIMVQRGFTVASGSLDLLLDALATRPRAKAEPRGGPTGGSFLPDQLIVPTVDVGHASSLSANALRLFNGSPATYADIRTGLTFRRSLEEPLLNDLEQRSLVFLPIIGVGGVGKTSVGRRLVAELVERGFLGFEHRVDFPLRAREWIEVERRLARAQRRGVLLIDDCPAFLNQVNELAELLGSKDQPALTLILTSGRSQWLPRNKSPRIFQRGALTELRELTEPDLRELVNLIRQQDEIRKLVHSPFSRLSRQEQLSRLRKRCSADMYVCLKNIFASRSLDNILLREYADLPDEQQGIYRTVAALEAGGTRVHRQLLIRILSLGADTIGGLLHVMEGLVSEHEIDANEGLYGWTTRHPLIAERIAHYKFADQAELFRLLTSVVENLNPSISLELRTLRDLCNYEFGIRRLEDHEQQIQLFASMITAAPGERIPRHRLIGKYLRLGRFDEAEHSIREAEEEVGLDPPISSYKTRLALQRADARRGIRAEDRVVFYAEAKTQALQHIRKYPFDKYGYIVYGDVAVSFARRYEKTAMLDEAIERARKAVGRILDPQLSHALDDLIRTRANFAKTPNK